MFDKKILETIQQCANKLILAHFKIMLPTKYSLKNYTHTHTYIHIYIYIYIYIYNIHSVSEDSGCGLFEYRIYEHIFFHPGLYNKTHIHSVYSAIRRKLKPG